MKDRRKRAERTRERIKGPAAVKLLRPVRGIGTVVGGRPIQARADLSLIGAVRSRGRPINRAPVANGIHNICHVSRRNTHAIPLFMVHNSRRGQAHTAPAPTSLVISSFHHFIISSFCFLSPFLVPGRFIPRTRPLHSGLERIQQQLTVRQWPSTQLQHGRYLYRYNNNVQYMCV